MALQPKEDILIIAGLYLLGPETVVIVVAAKARDADAITVLRTGDNAITPFWIVLKAEHQLGQGLRIHIGELVGPNLTDNIAGAGGETATLTHLKSGLQTDGDGPTGGVLAHVRLETEKYHLLYYHYIVVVWTLKIAFLKELKWLLHSTYLSILLCIDNALKTHAILGIVLSVLDVKPKRLRMLPSQIMTQWHSCPHHMIHLSVWMLNVYGKIYCIFTYSER